MSAPLNYLTKKTSYNTMNVTRIELQDMILQAQNKVAQQGDIVKQLRVAKENFQDELAVLNNLKTHLNDLFQEYDRFEMETT